METYEQRLKRFQNSSPDESISTLLNSIHNFFVTTELKLAAEQKLYYLLILGIHAVAKTISESIYGKSGLVGFRFYLEKFVDGNTTVLKFSNIAAELNTWRNILAHQWIAGMGHRWGFDDQMKEGWKKESGVIIINPQRYFEQFNEGFGVDGPVWDYEKLLNKSGLEKAKKQIIKKFLER